MRTIETALYTFDELSDSAKDQAREWYRNGNLDYEWWDCIYEDAAIIADIIGIDIRQRRVKLMDGSHRYDPDIYFSGFYCQGSGSTFSGEYKYKKGSKKEIRSHAPLDTELHRIADELQAIQSRFFYAISASISTNDRYGINVSVDYDPNNYQYLPEGVDQEIEDLLNDFNNWIFGQLEWEYEYLNSDEAIDESIRANEYEFNQNGSIA